MTGLVRIRTRAIVSVRNPPSGLALAIGPFGQAGPAGASGVVTGVNDWYIPAADLIPRVTSGPSRGLVEMATNKQMVETLDFDTATQEYANVARRLPKRWDAGTVTITPYWTAASGSGTVAWSFAAVCLADDAAIDTAYGTAQTSADTLLSANDMHIGPATAAITVASAAKGAMVWLRVSRDVANDTLGVDAKLIGLVLHWTAEAGNDA